jgi:hypothetical protein
MNEPTFTNLLKPEFTISGILFRIKEADAERQFDILEKIRNALSDPAGIHKSVGDAKDETRAGAAILKAALSIDPAKMKSIRIDLFELVDVRLEGTGQSVPLPEVWEIVKKKIKGIDIYEIIVRAIAVNFTESLRGLASRFGLNLAKDQTQTLPQD